MIAWKYELGKRQGLTPASPDPGFPSQTRNDAPTLMKPTPLTGRVPFAILR
jgi:hypothetical protein